MMSAVKRRPATALERLFRLSPPAYAVEVSVLTYVVTCPFCGEGNAVYNDDGRALGSEIDCEHCGEDLVMPKRVKQKESRL